ncbi:hypothetical protein PLESTB_000151800 [Pleodorina starrii]|uniref:Protein kinase domain-containing protein n=1 Tax=Pleodorina starrii TaxID=330485 RepID=A0A9W6BC41_9CHLO|nr:hypothetical protein PLESTM_000450600 [Pleodorina starrii]GLC48816.1 hypothetical protein PLESTB_000151800 [Pleodorina starrii]GLC72555.1 hypothetical protein PLESTF_001264300 [Pleodorina starrii]
MTAVQRPIRETTRRAVCRILGSADSLPDRSKASKVLTTVACRLQLFVIELERAHYERFGVCIEQLLDRCHEHCQLLGVAGIQGGGVQSGYALLSELLEMLKELETLILLLPGQLCSDFRCKAALDELQALFANVSQYRTECQDTKQHLEAALIELVHGCTARENTTGAAAASSQVTDATQAPANTPSHSTEVQPGPEHSSSSGGGGGGGGGSSGKGSGDAAFDAHMADGAATGETAVLQRVRQVICALDLDVDMADRDQEDLDAELQQLRSQMQRALQQQPQQPQQQEMDGLDAPPVETQPAASVRRGARRRRDTPATTTSESATSSAPLCSLSPASSTGSTGAGGSGGAASRASRLQAARHVSRSLAAQHLASLKERQRQLRLESLAAAGTAGAATEAAGGGDSDVQRAAQRRKVWMEAEAVGAAAPVASAAAAAGGLAGPALTAFGKELRNQAAEPTKLERLDPNRGAAGIPAVSAGGSVLAAPSSATDVSGSAASAGDSGDPRVGAATDNAPELCPGSVLGVGGSTAAKVPGRAMGVPAGQAGPSQQGLVARPCDGGGAAGAAAVAAGGTYTATSAEAPPDAAQRRPTEASVSALRKLNRVTQLAGMWEAGRPVAQQGAAEVDDADGGGGGGSLSDCEELSCGARRGGGGSDADGGELPARPAPRRPSAAVAAAAAAAAPLPALPALPGQAASVAASSPFFMLAIQGRAPAARPPPVLGRLLVPPPEAEPLVDEAPASPAAAPPRGSGNNSPSGSPRGAAAAAAAAGAPGVLRLRGAAAAAVGGAAPAPLPLPGASVHLRAVGLPGCFAPHWAPPGPFGLPAQPQSAAAAAGTAAAAAGGLWLGVGGGAAPAAGGEGDASGGGGGNGAGAGTGQLLDFGPDVPTLDLHRDISGWGPCLGRGAFGAVYKALFRNKPAAVKVLHGGTLDVRDIRSLCTEISLLCRLRHHPNIIEVYGAAVAPPDHVALVTELMDCDLYDYIHRRRQNCVPLDEVLSIARAIASGLSELHPAIVHRDLKPANVMLRLRHSPGGPAGAAAGAAQPLQLDRRLTVKIADFGLARHKRSQYLSTRERDAGTLKYMAPECIASGGSAGANDNGGGEGGGGEGGGGNGGGGGITEKCDIYSFGVLLYELITGREPWEGCHPLYAMCQVQSGVTLQLPDDPARCPPVLRALVLRCWSYQHHQRPGSKELLRELDAIIAARQQQQQQQQLAAAAEGDAAPAEAHVPPPWQ